MLRVRIEYCGPRDRRFSRDFQRRRCEVNNLFSFGPCGQGAAIAHAAVGTGMQTTGNILLAAPDPNDGDQNCGGNFTGWVDHSELFFNPDCSKNRHLRKS